MSWRAGSVLFPATYIRGQLLPLNGNESSYTLNPFYISDLEMHWIAIQLVSVVFHGEASMSSGLEAGKYIA